MKKLRKHLRITTAPQSLKILLKGQHRFMSENGFEVIGVSSNGQELQDIGAEERIRTVVLEMTRTISPLKDLRSLCRFYHICKREKPLIVHSHTPKAGIVGMLGALLAGVPIRLHTVAGLPLMEAKGLKRIILNLVEVLTYRCATKVYPNSLGLKDFILRHGFTSEKKIKVFASGSSNGINTAFFQPNLFASEQKVQLKNQFKIHSTDIVFAFVGRLVKDKGINELVDAFKQINKVNSATKLLLVGPFERELDPLTKETEQEIESNPSIITVGFQKDVRPYLAISDIFVFPSYREGFPNVVMQAGAMGLPSIVTDINGSNEIIVNGKNGIIIPSKNTQELKKAMLGLLKDKELRNSLAENARPMIESRYQQEVVWNAILEEYNKLIAEIEK